MEGDFSQTIMTSWRSPAEDDNELLSFLGTMTVRFNVLELYLSIFIALKMKINMKGETYDHISNEMMFLEKVKILGSYLPDGLKSRLKKINTNRNKIIHGLFSLNMKSKKITKQYKKKTIDNLNHFLFEVNTEISNLCKEIHKIIIHPIKLEEN